MTYDVSGEYRWRNAFDGAVGMLTPRVSFFNVDAWDYMYTQSLTQKFLARAPVA